MPFCHTAFAMGMEDVTIAVILHYLIDAYLFYKRESEFLDRSVEFAKCR